MFDVGWSEILVIAVVAVVVVGPKELPSMLRTFGRTMGQVRRTANGFRRQFDEALREAEREVDLEETRKSLQSAVKIDPLADLKAEFASGSPANPVDALRPAESPAVAAGAHEAEPLKIGAVSPDSAPVGIGEASPERGSNAA